MMGAEGVVPIIGVVLACAALAVSRASLHRRLWPKLGCARPRPKPSRALSDAERTRVLDVLRSPRFVDQSPAEVVYTLLDEGEYLCSVRGMYRILCAFLSANAEVRERRNQLRHPAYAKPELLATAPKQVWSWDITELRGPGKWERFYLYVAMDIFSRKTVGWMLAREQNARLAERLIRETCQRERVEYAQLIIHSDRGTQMKSKTLAQLYADLDITPSFSRPQVSNDNPYSEAQFKTMKYSPDFPDRFASMDEARAFCLRFFQWYKEEHRHSGLRYLTPSQVHLGAASEVVSARQGVLDAAHALHPERFVKRPPKALPPPSAVYINPPKGEETEAGPPGVSEVLETPPVSKPDEVDNKALLPAAPALRDQPVGAPGRPGRPRPGEADGPTAGLERAAVGLTHPKPSLHWMPQSAEEVLH